MQNSWGSYFGNKCVSKCLPERPLSSIMTSAVHAREAVLLWIVREETGDAGIGIAWEMGSQELACGLASLRLFRTGLLGERAASVRSVMHCYHPSQGSSREAVECGQVCTCSNAFSQRTCLLMYHPPKPTGCIFITWCGLFVVEKSLQESQIRQMYPIT